MLSMLRVKHVDKLFKTVITLSGEEGVNFIKITEIIKMATQCFLDHQSIHGEKNFVCIIRLIKYSVKLLIDIILQLNTECKPFLVEFKKKIRKYYKMKTELDEITVFIF